MAVYRSIEYLQDCNQISTDKCQLVILDRGERFALSCHVGDDPTFVVLENGEDPPAIDAFTCECVNLGTEFIVDFDVLTVTWAQPIPGAVTVLDDRLLLCASLPPHLAQRITGGVYLIDLQTSKVEGFTAHSVPISDTWSLTVPALARDGTSVPIYSRTPPISA